MCASKFLVSLHRLPVDPGVTISILTLFPVCLLSALNDICLSSADTWHT